MKSIGLALGSGGARGWAHIGVLRALQEAEITVNYISGASIGALVGAIYCAGELDELEDFIRDLSWRDMLAYFDMVFPTSGLLDGSKVYELLSEHIQGMKIEESEIPFCCVATDLIKGEEVHLTTGSMVDAVRASISVPGIFTPFCHGDRYLVDGGIVNPVPVDVVRKMGAEIVIAVNLNRNDITSGLGKSSSPADPTHGLTVSGKPEEEDADDKAITPPPSSSEASKRRKESFLKNLSNRYLSLQETLSGKVDQWLPDEDQGLNIFDVIGTSLNVMEQQVTRSRLETYLPDLLVEPPLNDFPIFDFHKADRIIRMGYTAMKQQLPAVKDLL
ncbi:patatin family protein [Synechococcus sp. BSF8S]|uniref:patatin family protein n=1 Tax=Synechococcales TaxID=1890424 RepID=UPI001625BAA5|nr:patatin family protein [Synechococcus sp. BSF8S]MBC1260862.1 patatin family protein [Synechococcus sp. BSF8S]MBC1263538.1 patatin family protein [Synechococcus sp. BSA11S]